jgi:hypothetical protein
MLITGVPYDTMGMHPLKKWSYCEQLYHGICFFIDLHVMNEGTFQIK